MYQAYLIVVLQCLCQHRSPNNYPPRLVPPVGLGYVQERHIQAMCLMEAGNSVSFTNGPQRMRLGRSKPVLLRPVYPHISC